MPIPATNLFEIVLLIILFIMTRYSELEGIRHLCDEQLLAIYSDDPYFR
jgi:hypothetical protein